MRFRAGFLGRGPRALSWRHVGGELLVQLGAVAMSLLVDLFYAARARRDAP